MHVAAAVGDTSGRFAPGQILSGGGTPADAAIGDDGTVGVTWRTGRLPKVQVALAGPGQELTSRSTTTVSGTQARGPRMAIAAGRATVAWFRLVKGFGRAVEATHGRPGERLARARRISDTKVATVAPHVENSSHGASWIAWGARPVERPSTTYFRVLKARKLTLRTGRFSRELDILRARANFNDERLSFRYDVLPSRNGAMLATVHRVRPGSSQFFQVRTYGE